MVPTETLHEAVGKRSGHQQGLAAREGGLESPEDAPGWGSRGSSPGDSHPRSRTQVQKADLKGNPFVQGKVQDGCRRGGEAGWPRTGSGLGNDRCGEQGERHNWKVGEEPPCTKPGPAAAAATGPQGSPMPGKASYWVTYAVRLGTSPVDVTRGPFSLGLKGEQTTWSWTWSCWSILKALEEDQMGKKTGADGMG